MRNEFLKTLWMLRFEKIRDGEDEAAWNYQKMADQCSELLGKDHETVKILKKLVRDETTHGQLARELIQICERTRPDISVMDH